MRRGIDLQQKPKQMDDAPGIFVAEPTGLAIGAARIERKDRLEMRRIELRRHQLFSAEAGNAHHPHIAVAPGLPRNPFDQIVAVERARAAGLRFADAAGISDHVHIATPDEKARVAGLRRTGPQHRPRRMRQRRLGDLGALQVLVVDRESQEGRELVGRVRAIDVDRDLDAVAHRHEHVLLGDHAGIGPCTIIVDRYTLAGQREVKGRRLRHCCLALRSHRCRSSGLGAVPTRRDSKSPPAIVTARQPCAGALDLVSCLGLLEPRAFAKKASTTPRETRREKRPTMLRFAALHAGVESPFAWLRLVPAVVLSTIASVGMWSVPVVLPAVQAEFGVARADASLPFTLAMIGFACGGVMMGRLTDRFGIGAPVICGALALSTGYVAAG